MAASRLTAATNLVAGTTNPPPAEAPDANDPVEKEYKKLMEDDDAVQAEVDEWIKDNAAAAAKGGGVPPADLQLRIRERFAPIRKAYEDFIARHPDHARARVAYGSFLGDMQEEDAAQEQWEKALALNAKDPAVDNNLANLYANDEIEREGVYLPLARIKLAAERFAEARAHLIGVTNQMYDVLKNRLARNIDQQEREAKGTNGPSPVPEKKP